jgi:hypothetical protein
LNSGDWIESLTAIIEHADGRFELLDFATFLREYPMPVEEPVTEFSAADTSRACSGGA